jgi:hypothetical protein
MYQWNDDQDLPGKLIQKECCKRSMKDTHKKYSIFSSNGKDVGARHRPVALILKSSLYGINHFESPDRVAVWECKFFTVTTVKEYGSITTLQILHIFS